MLSHWAPHRLVVAALKALREQMTEDGTVPDEGDVYEQMQGACGIGQWIDPDLLAAGRAEEMEYMRSRGMYTVVPKTERMGPPWHGH